jgi:hypothetical protein
LKTAEIIVIGTSSIARGIAYEFSHVPGISLRVAIVGRSVITEAGDHPKVTGLVYVEALASEAGETLGDLAKDFPRLPLFW